jgi:hypothetical protein
VAPSAVGPGLCTATLKSTGWIGGASAAGRRAGCRNQGMACVDLVAAVGTAIFGGGILVGGHGGGRGGDPGGGAAGLAAGTVTLRDDPAGRMARGVRRINGVGLRDL